MTPTITDDDKGTITATVDGKMVRSWEYGTSGGRSYVMAKAREYAEGWHNCMIWAEVEREDLLHMHRALLAYGDRSNRSAEDRARHLVLLGKVATLIRNTPKAPQ